MAREKPFYAEGTEVQFDLGDGKVRTGRIRGRALEHIIDFWIVEPDTKEGFSDYPWSCVVIPHSFLISWARGAKSTI